MFNHAHLSSIAAIVLPTPCDRYATTLRGQNFLFLKLFETLIYIAKCVIAQCAFHCMVQCFPTLTVLTYTIAAIEEMNILWMAIDFFWKIII
jgi:hypothetical protein